MLLAEVISVLRPRKTENCDLKLGSSKQGNDWRASDDSKLDTANHLWVRKKKKSYAIITQYNFNNKVVLSDTIFLVRRSIESSAKIV